MKHTYKIIRSKRKTLALEVNKNLEVIVRAPLYTSESVISDFVSRHEQWIDKATEKVKTKLQNRPKEPTKAQAEYLRKQAAEYIPKRVDYYSKIMNLKPTGIKITSAKTRFGSCSGKDSLCFSLRLMMYPEAAIDYVVVHELAHIKHKNHGKRFYSLIEKYMPDYKMREKLLKNPLPKYEN